MNGSTHSRRTDSGQCTAVEILLAEYQAGELDRAEADLVASHLEQCASCRAELAREIHLGETLASLPLVRCPQRVTDFVMEAAAGTNARHGVNPPLSRRWTTFVGVAAVAAALVLMLAGPLEDGQSDQAALPRQEAFTQAEVDAARQDLKRSLLYTARIINRTERSTVKEVFGHTLPESLNRSIKTIMTTPEGGQG